jgi:hypothetical protein
VGDRYRDGELAGLQDSSFWPHRLRQPTPEAIAEEAAPAALDSGLPQLIYVDIKGLGRTIASPDDNLA